MSREYLNAWMTHLAPLIVDVNSAGFVFSLVVVQLCVQGGANNQILEAVAVQVSGANRVAEIGSKLGAGHVEDVHQIPGV